MSYELTRQLAAQLGEVAPVALGQIRRVIEVVGAATAQALADAAVAIAAGDGMLTPAGNPHTVGGIFFTWCASGYRRTWCRRSDAPRRAGSSSSLSAPAGQ